MDSTNQVAKRKNKENRRRDVKNERKNRLVESKNQTLLKKVGSSGKLEPKDEKQAQKQKEKQVLKKHEQQNVATLTQEQLAETPFTEKLQMVKALTANIIAYPAFSYRKLKDLLLMCSDNNIDVVLKAAKCLCDVFCDILPDYRIRQIDDEEAKKEGKISKQVQEVRSQEQSLLQAYKEYLTILETFCNIKTAKITKDAQAVATYDRLKHLSIENFCRLFERHSHFNYRLNILQILASKMPSQDLIIRRMCTASFKAVLKKDDNNLLEFKLDMLREMHKTIKAKAHDLFDPTILDCLTLHDVMVDESKAKIIDDATKNATQMHEQMSKLRKKGKYAEYKSMRDNLMVELKETDAIGVDLAKVGKTNNLIIKETLAIYFEIIKQKRGSPLLRSVFLGLGQFTKYVNVEIVWDLISVMREYFKIELLETSSHQSRNEGISNILAGLLCAFQIMEVGSGSIFNVDAKDFTIALYHVIQRMYEQPRLTKTCLKDFTALLKCLEIVLIQKKQLSGELINSFVKRLSLLQMHLQPAYQAAVLYVIKQLMNKYPSARSSMLEIEDDTLGGGFQITPRIGMYKGDLNDPQLSNAGQSNIIFEMLHTMEHWTNYLKVNLTHGDNRRPELKLAHLNLKLVRSILASDSIPSELLTATPAKILLEYETSAFKPTADES